MKKLLFLVLIAFAISTVVEQTEDLDVVLEARDWAAEWNKVKDILANAKKWLQDRGLYTPLVNAITNSGKKAAENLCKKYGVPGAVCSSIVSWIAKKILHQ